MGHKTKISKAKIELRFLTTIDLPCRDHHFGMVERQNRIKIIELCQFKVGAKVASWPIMGQQFAILATFFEIWTSKLFCP